MTLDELARKFRGPARRTAKGVLVFCPAHEDLTKQSLSLDRGDNGGLVAHCFAGCATETVLATAGLTLRDLAPTGHVNGTAPRPGTKSARTIVKTYDYVGVDGASLYQVVRYVPKDFLQRRPNGRGGWLWDIKVLSAYCTGCPT